MATSNPYCAPGGAIATSLSPAESTADGGHQDRIRRFPESRLKCALRQILAENPLIRKPDDLAINIRSAPGSDFSAADRDDCLCHWFILALKLNPSLLFQPFAMVHDLPEFCTSAVNLTYYARSTHPHPWVPTFSAASI